MDETNPVLQALKRAYESGNLIVFVGAGVSRAAGLPTWRELAEYMFGSMQKHGASIAAKEEVEGLLKSNQLIEALSAIQFSLGGQEFKRQVEQFLDDQGRQVPAAAQAIADLKPHLRAVLTTNIDKMLERAFHGEWDVFDAPVGNIAQMRHYIFKLHGTLRKWDHWVFSRDEYDRAMFGSPALQDAFGSLYRSYPILFVGSSLDDDNLDQTFGKVRALSGGQPPEHFGLFAKGIPPFRKKKLQDSGVRLIEYNPADNHAELTQILQWLARSTDPVSVTVTTGSAHSSQEQLQPPTPTQVVPATTSQLSTLDTTTNVARPVRIFICYAPQDDDFLKRLETHMTRLKRDGLITVWHEGHIVAGDDYDEAIHEHLDAAELILPLISADFMASEPLNTQVARAMEMRAAGKAEFAPILVKPYDLKHTRFEQLRALLQKHKDSPPLPISKWPHQDEAFDQIIRELRTMIERRRKKGSW